MQDSMGSRLANCWPGPGAQTRIRRTGERAQEIRVSRQLMLGEVLQALAASTQPRDALLLRHEQR